MRKIIILPLFALLVFCSSDILAQSAPSGLKTGSARAAYGYAPAKVKKVKNAKRKKRKPTDKARNRRQQNKRGGLRDGYRSGFPM